MLVLQWVCLTLGCGFEFEFFRRARFCVYFVAVATQMSGTCSVDIFFFSFNCVCKFHCDLFIVDFQICTLKAVLRSQFGLHNIVKSWLNWCCQCVLCVGLGLLRHAFYSESVDRRWCKLWFVNNRLNVICIDCNA